ncbi:MAG: metalloregulator ArsR/SmtB family transcription factor [Hoeflea sp.]|uniref:ArsR/SmtB family transcription factor n=1 Tax=Hoeflea sp. TaxID=1940281 RepID=UPI00272F087B|nr:metalloregulator ArsR/SmtB family transcription factor [Hoeflea sp.]MDP2122067.1 metalloregulator ArsR/SmtB family transcription factor [Hoeflea sp.]MDP3526147.1 metalloregulator ArsR/SmtB family transcription factor [Hoeflea sp.]
MARKLAALAHPARLGILRQLGAGDSCCVKDLVRRAGLAQSTVSQHLKILLEAELVTFRPEQQRSRYTLNAAALRELAGVISQTLDHCCTGCCPQTGHAPHSDTSRQAAVHKDN